MPSRQILGDPLTVRGIVAIDKLLGSIVGWLVGIDVLWRFDM